MGSTYVPTQTVTSQVVGSTSVTDPILLLRVNGELYSSGYTVTYGTDSSGGYRLIYPGYDPSNGSILISSFNVAIGQDLPALTLSNLEVLVIG